MGRGRAVYKQPGTRVDTRIAPHRKEGFQVSKRDLGTRGVIKGSYQGELSRGVIKGLCHKLNIVNLYIYIVLLCECG
jgi:hypothetical protein